MSDVLNNIMKDVKKKSAFDVALLSSDDSPCVVRDFFPTGSIVLDSIMGGGYPVGRFVEIYGDASSGKTLLAEQAAATLMENSKEAIVLYIDTEHALSVPITEAVGIDKDRLIVASPDTIEDVFELMENVIESRQKHADGAPLLIIWDSIAATSAKKEQESEYGKATMGKHAQLISHGLRKIKGLVSKSDVCVILLNQVRVKIGVMFGDNTTTFGGKAVEFYSSIRVHLVNSTKIKDGKRIIGRNTRATVTKNKVAMPFKSAQLPIYFGHGVHDIEASYLYLVDVGVIEGSGRYKKCPALGLDRLQRKDWAKIYEERRDDIRDLVITHEQYVPDGDGSDDSDASGEV